jgi:hypothetical protein
LFFGKFVAGDEMLMKKLLCLLAGLILLGAVSALAVAPGGT